MITAHLVRAQNRGKWQTPTEMILFFGSNTLASNSGKWRISSAFPTKNVIYKSSCWLLLGDTGSSNILYIWSENNMVILFPMANGFIYLKKS